MAISTLVFLTAGIGFQKAVVGQESLIKNGEFRWNGEQLSDWEIGDGAGAGSVNSHVRPVGDSRGLELNGNSSTGLWKYVGQDFAISGGQFVKLSYTARSQGVRREVGQNNNCYVAIWFSNRRGRIGNTFFTIASDEFATDERIVEIPDGTTKATAMVFLSMTGTLSVQQIDIVPLSAEDSFQILVDQMDRYYSYFDHKGIDWVSLTNKYRAEVEALTVDDTKNFEKLILRMLSELNDGHVWIDKGGLRIPAAGFQRQPILNYDFNVIDEQLESVQKFGNLGLVAKTKDNLGYVRITSLQAEVDDLRPLLRSIGAIYDTRGMIVDLRANGGGSETLGRMVAGVFCKEPVTYAINRFRKNSSHDEFNEYPRGPLQPIRGEIYDQPVVCLIGPGAVSSAEGTALMFKALPNAVLIGQPTRGSSGNPAPVKLPNGVEVWFSRWVACNASGQPIEGRGVQPDILVEHGTGDPAFERAVKELSK